MTFEVLRHKLWQVADEMGTTLVKVSGSPIVTEVLDFATVVFTGEGEMAAMGCYCMLHAGAMPTTVKNTIKLCQKDPGIEEGDMFIVNDPFMGTAQQSDVVILAPFHYKGELLGWTGCMCHQLDIGAFTLGGFPTGVTEVYQEGIRLTPVKLIEMGKLRTDIWRAIMNMVRLPQVGLDLRGEIAANNVAKERLRVLCDKYGPETLKAAMSQLMTFSEQKFTSKLKALPDGVYRYRDYLDFDGYEDDVIRLLLKMTKKSDRLTFDFTGSSNQAKGFVNTTYATTVGCVLSAIFPWLCHDILPWNHGIIRSIDVFAPEGTICNAMPPAPVSAGNIRTGWIVKQATQYCLSSMLACSDDHGSEAMAPWYGGEQITIISGLNQRKEPSGIYLMDTLAGGGGARATLDGVDGGGNANAPTLSIPNIETYEWNNPVLFLFRRQTTDSGGPGKFRGGAAIEEMFTPYDTAKLHLTTGFVNFRAPNSSGIFGGLPGCAPTILMRRSTDLHSMISSGKIPLSIEEVGGAPRVPILNVPTMYIEPGDVVYERFMGGGGFGDPIERDPERVLKDIADGLVSEKWARRIYGVAITGTKVNSGATEHQRNKLRMSRRKQGRSRTAN